MRRSEPSFFEGEEGGSLETVARDFGDFGELDGLYENERWGGRDISCRLIWEGLGRSASAAIASRTFAAAVRRDLRGILAFCEERRWKKAGRVVRREAELEF